MWKYGFLTLFLLFCLCLSATEKKDFEKAEREQCPSYYSCRLVKEWQRIESIIRSMELSLPDYDAHRKEIEDRLDRGEYVEHHSKVFEESYSPHYRIISRQIFEKELRPLL